MKKITLTMLAIVAFLAISGETEGMTMIQTISMKGISLAVLAASCKGLEKELGRGEER